jgi:predicted PolB exonuclease-like 3'-5' exonuclease
MIAPTRAALDTAYLVFDTESIPDGRLVAMTKYPGEALSPEEAIARAQAEAREQSGNGSDFLPVSFQVPVAVCVARVGEDFRLQALRCLDAPHFRPREIVRKFWEGRESLAGPRGARLVTFNGRGFDLPLMELAAFRYGLALPRHFGGAKGGVRHRYSEQHIDLMELLTNFGACRLAGGLNLLSKLLGKPGKTEASGGHVYKMYREGRLQAINEYCAFDVLDTYFVFLRTRVLVGQLSLDEEQEIVRSAHDWLTRQSAEQPFLKRYLANWGDWEPWP